MTDCSICYESKKVFDIKCCNNSMCKECIEKIFINSDTAICPYCRRESYQDFNHILFDNTEEDFEASLKLLDDIEYLNKKKYKLETKLGILYKNIENVNRDLDDINYIIAKCKLDLDILKNKNKPRFRINYDNIMNSALNSGIESFNTFYSNPTNYSTYYNSYNSSNSSNSSNSFNSSNSSNSSSNHEFNTNLYDLQYLYDRHINTNIRRSYYGQNTN